MEISEKDFVRSKLFQDIINETNCQLQELNKEKMIYDVELAT